jgi:dihydroorotate dehydrogenase
MLVAMSMYSRFFRKLLFQLDPEVSHGFALQSLQLANQLGLTKFYSQKIPPAEACRVMGITFPNRIGLAAGMDKNGDYIAALATLGFGFIEIGTVTLKPQSGNPLPRLFRLAEHEAIINRMGFNNKGCDYVVGQLKRTNYRGILGINIGKNFDTPLENANNDYIQLFRRLAPYASYITLNISSPNTQELRNLQHGELLTSLLKAIKQEQQVVADQQKKYVPIVIKIAPDLTDEQLQMIAQIALAAAVDGIIATNTTLSRVGVETSQFANEAGGLSGKPLLMSANSIIKKLNDLLEGKIPIIASGGVSDGEAVQAKFLAGAQLVQLYSGLIYQGPGLVAESIANCPRMDVTGPRP